MDVKLPEALKGEVYEFSFGEAFRTVFDAIEDDAKDELKLFPNGLDVAIVLIDFACFALV